MTLEAKVNVFVSKCINWCETSHRALFPPPPQVWFLRSRSPSFWRWVSALCGLCNGKLARHRLQVSSTSGNCVSKTKNSSVYALSSNVCAHLAKRRLVRILVKPKGLNTLGLVVAVSAVDGEVFCRGAVGGAGSEHPHDACVSPRREVQLSNGNARQNCVRWVRFVYR